MHLKMSVNSKGDNKSGTEGEYSFCSVAVLVSNITRIDTFIKLKNVSFSK